MSTKSPSIAPDGHFFAEFAFEGSPDCLLRKDTRVYLHPQDAASISRDAGRCVGVVWMCNPGTAGRPAGPRPWGDVQPDTTLRVVLEMYRRAAALKTTEAAAKDEPGAGKLHYILVLNCYYAVDRDHAAAYQRWIASNCHYRERIPKKARFILPAWGAGKPNGPVAQAIQRIRRRKKKRPELYAVYIDAPLARGGKASLSDDLSLLNYPLHPLNPQFGANLPNLAAALAPLV